MTAEEVAFKPITDLRARKRCFRVKSKHTILDQRFPDEFMMTIIEKKGLPQDASVQTLSLLEEHIEALQPSHPTIPFGWLERAVELSAFRERSQLYRSICTYFSALFEGRACVLLGWEAAPPRLTVEYIHVPSQNESSAQWLQPEQPNALPLVMRAIREVQPLQVALAEVPFATTERAWMQAVGSERMLLFPLVAHERVVGVVEVMLAQLERSFAPWEIRLGCLLGEQAGLALENIRTVEELRQRTTELEVLRQANLSLTASLNVHEVLDALLESTLKFMGDAQDAHIFLYERGRLKFAAALWADGRKGQPYAHPRPHGLTYTVARRGEILVVDDMRTHPLFTDAPPSWTGSIVGIPLKIGKRVVGVMTVAHPQTGAFSASQVRVLRMLGEQAAIAINNARLHHRIARQAQTDPLTGLFNRRALDERLDEEILRAVRFGYPLALLMIDLDNFKTVNDTYGHPIGDRLLQQVAACLRRSVRDWDFVARYGGDEFALVLPNMGYRAARRMALRLRQTIASTTWDLPPQDDIRISLSFGIAVYPKHGETKEALLAAADRALYQEKA